eukprot:3007-Heterococcus_DN1.PRE.2
MHVRHATEQGHLSATVTFRCRFCIGVEALYARMHCRIDALGLSIDAPRPVQLSACALHACMQPEPQYHDAASPIMGHTIHMRV